MRGNIPTWPERFDLEKIEEIKKHTGARKFASQMLLEPCDLGESILQTQNLKIYSYPLKSNTSCNLETFSVGKYKIVSSACVWDPSFNAQNSDNSVVSLVLFDDSGNVFLQAIKYLPKLGANENNSLTNMQFQIKIGRAHV